MISPLQDNLFHESAQAPIYSLLKTGPPLELLHNFVNRCQ